jgi:hypothetical protein
VRVQVNDDTRRALQSEAGVDLATFEHKRNAGARTARLQSRGGRRSADSPDFGGLGKLGFSTRCLAAGSAAAGESESEHAASSTQHIRQPAKRMSILPGKLNT